MIMPPKLQSEAKPTLKSPYSTPVHQKKVTIRSNTEDSESMSAVTNFVDNVSIDRPQDHLLEC